MPDSINDVDLLGDIMWDDAEGYRVITSIDEGGSRWHRLMSTVFVRESDNKLFIAEWRKGATENQEHELPDIAHEAEEFTKTITSYRRISGPKVAGKVAKPTAPKAVS